MAENLAGATSEAVEAVEAVEALDFGINLSLKHIVGFMNIAGAAVETLKRNLLDEHEEPTYIRDISVDVAEGLQELFGEVKSSASDIAKKISAVREELGLTPF